MASAAFRSATKRTSIGASADDDSRSSGARRRARSVSRSSHRLPQESAASPAAETRGKFVNTARGGAFEISLDDLAIELFSSGERARGSEVSSFGATPALRRGRSVARQAAERKSGGGSAVTGGSTARAVSERRRRSVSVVRYRASDSESDNSENYTRQINYKGLNNGNKHQAAVHKQAAPSQQRGLRRSSSQRDFVRSNNGYSSYSSVLTDDETRDVRYVSDGFENLRPISARKKSDLHNDRGVIRKELRHSVDDIKMSHEQVSDNENLSKLVNGVGLQQNCLDISTVRRSYSTKLDQSEKRKQELLAKIMLEEQHGKELKRFVGEWLPSAEETCVSRRPSRPRKRSNDKRRVSKLLNEEADKIIEDFISSVEDNTDISSFDDDRSDTSSTFGTTLRPKDVLMHFGEPEHYRTPTRLGPLPAEMDGVVLPWLQWETNTDSPLQCKNKTQNPATPKTVLQDTIEETGNTNKAEESNQSNSSSRGSWNPPLAESFSVDSEASKTKPAETRKSFSVDSEMNNTAKPAETRKSQLLATVPRRSKADINDYSASQSSDEFLFERWKLGARISSGGILICEGSRGPILL